MAFTQPHLLELVVRDARGATATATKTAGVPMKRRACVIVALLGACGPDAREVPEIQPWMSGIWSLTLMTESKMTPGPDGGIGENNDRQPTRYEILGDGTYTVFTLVNPGVYETFEGAWDAITDAEIRAEPTEDSDDSTSTYRWELGSGERGCDTIVVTPIREDGEGTSFNLYRGAVCTVQTEPCPPDAVPPHDCFYYHYTWCEDQGTNEEWFDGCREDCYCHFPGYEEGD